MPVMSGPQKKLTSAELLLLPDDGKRHELIDGVHYVTPSPRIPHQVLVGRIFVAIANFLAVHQHLGRVFLSPVDVVMSEHDLVVPDLLFVTRDQQSILTDANVQGVPALVVEVLSPSTRRRDEGIKRKLFDQKGVREYWVVDPKAMRVSICRRAEDGSFPIVTTLEASIDDQLSSPLLPAFSLSMRELFAEI
ncbi:MAG TPA: Uma2 family endonuclease [Vicinamibacterales bacterium]|nr:Uma2 family endonuclease [Vicinamibacterales bacterium]